ncbi:RNA polymerase sigma factor [Microbacterium sp. SS28]|uniref:RNA polymerase sigma factor n=1 Tax=Microbacterium sp. SS28 TaxID=2919948 RepID=UPI001FAB0F28|nr:sigma-70 family RNA polymerase sigma factor [Microbacterium sp. SS28]
MSAGGFSLPRPVPGTRRDGATARVEAVTELVEREAGSLLDYFLRRTTTPADAADLLGETLLVVWRRERSIPDDPTKARMWLFGVARKVFAGQRRTHARRTALTQRLGEELSVQGSAPDDGDLTARVRSVLELLDEIDQEIIRLAYWDGFSLAEVAEILSMRPATVRSRHARARAKLRSWLDAEGAGLGIRTADAENG